MRRLFAAVLLFGVLSLAAPAGADHSRLSHVSVGPAGGNGAFPADYVGPRGLNASVLSHLYERNWSNRTPMAEGESAYFVTRESLVPEDTNGFPDLYRRAGGGTELVSVGPTGAGAGLEGCGLTTFPQGPERCDFVSSVDGERAFFKTRAPLVAEDLDQNTDIYQRSNGRTSLVSTGPADPGAGSDLCRSPFCFDTFAISGDGSSVYFSNRRLAGGRRHRSRSLSSLWLYRPVRARERSH